MKLFNKEIKIKTEYIDKIKHLFSNKKTNIFLIVLASIFVVTLILGAVSKHLITLMPETLGADRWSKEHKMAQISLYFTEDQMVETDGIKRLEYNLENKLTDIGVTVETYIDMDKYADTTVENGVVDTILPDEVPPTVSDLYVSSYCAQGVVSLTFENRTIDKVNAIGVGGDFFMIHPLTLVSGSYFTDKNLMKDQIIIDEYLAWQLFGSSNIAGEMVTISNVPHYIAGVIKKDTGRIREEAGLSENYVYLSYDSLSKYGEILSGKTENKEISEDGQTAYIGGINCYEVIMPDPVDGIAAKIVKESSGTDERFISVIDNTKRFSFFSLIKVIKEFGTRSMWKKPIFYPYWENTARGYEDILALLLFFKLICISILVLSLVAVIIHLYRHKTWTVRGVVQILLDKKYEWECKRRKNYEEDSLF